MKYWGALLCFMLSSLLRAQTDTLIISEIMFYPVSGNNEYVELYNLSSVSIDLSGFRIKYYTSAPDSIKNAGYGTLLPPGGYAVVFEGDYDFENGIYKDIIPSSALKLKINSNAFGSNGMANTTSRPVWLISPQGDTTDYYFYSANNPVSISDEKKNMIKDTSSLFWKNSLVQNGTPGFRNSVHQYNKDIQLARLFVYPDLFKAGDDIELIAVTKNRGLLPAEQFTINFYNDINFDSIPSPSELFYSTDEYSLNSEDTVIISAPLYNISAGVYYFIAEAVYEGDEYLNNNSAAIEITVTGEILFNSVVINEVMYAPQNGEPEWIELYNNSADTINLKKWRIGDAVSSVLINSDYKIEPFSYGVLSKDSSITDYYPFEISFLKLSFPALNNTGDAIVIKDSLNGIVDSIYYLPAWGGSGNKSLERISPEAPTFLQENWGTSVNFFRGTPGFKNSLSRKNNDAAVNSFNTKEKYGIAGEEINLRICIRNRGYNALSDISVSVYHDNNCDSAAAASELINNFIIPYLLPEDSIHLSFPYRNFSLGTNCFIAQINNEDDDVYNNIAYCRFEGIEPSVYRNDIIINEIMYAPEIEPEWIELYNNTDADVNLKNFRIADKSDTSYLVRTNFILPPSEYLVISSDSLILQQRNINSLFLKSSLPSLNNTGDKVVIIDSLFRIIDSLQYSPHWGGRNGYSLERISFLSQSTDSLSWITSVNKYRGTPGYINSVSEKDWDAVLSDIIIHPPYPVTGDTVSVSVLLKNKGRNASDMSLKLYSDTNLLLYSSEFILAGGDSVLADNCYTIYNSVSIYAEVNTLFDQDTSNNYCIKDISFGFPPGSIVINEIHYAPVNRESEWIELYNRSSSSINLKNWSIKDVLSTPSAAVIKEDYHLLPYTYLVISTDTSVLNFHRVIPAHIINCNLPSFNNDADGAVLIDNRGITIDSMFYKNIPASGRSLERLSFDVSSSLEQNWESSKDIELSTPGRINSVTVKDHDLSSGGLFIEPRFPLLNDTVTISASVVNNGINAAENFDLVFYYGSPDTLLSSVICGYLSAGDSILVISPVPIIITAPTSASVDIIYDQDNDPLNNYSKKEIVPGEKAGSIVINEIMYDPEDGSPEWIELFNPSDLPYNLKNWSISDILPSPGKSFLSYTDVIINPGEYFIVSPDSSLLNIYPIEHLLISRFGSLSANGDGVILYDYRDAVIDSMKYIPKWGGRNGRSLERKSIHLLSADSSNWTSSLSSLKATPGQINSVSGLPDHKRNSVVINEVMYDPAVDNCEFAELYNCSDEPVNIGGWRLECGRNYFCISDTVYNLAPDTYLVFAADSTLTNKYIIDQGTVCTAGSSSLGFSNTGGILLLKDLNGNIIDSLYYSPKYHNRNFVVTKNRSLERINPFISSSEENWSSSASPEGATPGKVNSIHTDFAAASSGITISPNPFSPDNDGWEDYAVVSYNLKTEAPQIRIKIFDNTGRLVRTIADNKSSGSKGSVIFDGRDDEGRTLRIGIYILFFEAAGISGTETHKMPFVIARKL